MCPERKFDRGRFLRNRNLRETMVERTLTELRSEHSRDYTREKLILINEGNQEDLGEGSCRRKCPAHANSPQSQALCLPRANPKNLHTAAGPLRFLSARPHPFLSLAQSRAFCPARNVHQLFVRRARVNRRVKWPGEGFKDGEMGLRALLFADSVRIVSWFSINVWLDSRADRGLVEFKTRGGRRGCLHEESTMTNSNRVYVII